MPDASDANATQVPESDSVEEFGYRQELRRSLGFKELLVYGMLFMVPTAPMGVYGLVSQAAPGQVPLVYLVGVLAMLFTAIAFRNLSAAFPIAGSVYAYVQRGLNPHVGFVGGWLILLDYLMVPSLLYAFVGTWLHGLYPPIPAWIYVAVIIVAITSLNVLGITITARANWILFGLQILVLFAFVGTALLWLLSRGDAGASLSRLWRPGPVDLGVISAASSTAVLSYLGFDGISALAEETKDPRRNVGRAIMACLLLMGAIFMVITALAQSLVPDTSVIEGFDPSIGFFQIAGFIGGSWLYQLTLWSQIIGAGAGNTITAMGSVARILYGMGRDAMIPRFFARVHPRFGTPWLAILFMAAFSAVMAILIPLETLVRLVNFGAVSAFIILNFTSFWYGFVKQGRRGLAATLNHVAAPALGILVLGFVWWGLDLPTKLAGLAWFVAGIVWGAAKSRGYREVPEAFRHIEGA